MSNNIGVEMGFKCLSNTNITNTISFFKNNFMPKSSKFDFVYYKYLVKPRNRLAHKND